MKYLTIVLLILGVFSQQANTFEFNREPPEPSVETLGAPLYPGSTYIRTIASINPYYRSVLYVCPEPVGDVKNYYIENIPRKRTVQYREQGEWVWTFLLREKMPFPDKPTRDDIAILDDTPNVQVRKYQPALYYPLEELLASRPDSEIKLEALKKAKTIIRYTFQFMPENVSFNKIIGEWRNVDRDLHDYYGSVFRFNPDSTYTLTLSDMNIASLVKSIKSADTPRALLPEYEKKPQELKNMSSETLTTYIKQQNPEKGYFSIMRNTITLETNSAVMGQHLKSGLVEVGGYSMTVQFINMPRLTFIRTSSE